ncbi:phosphoribosylanthranilate isomerase [Vulcanisaeta sp. JCM 14467]|uniref:phosphoribosylanthranilate isomerase n=1 Tax=Vulcanisaeta sp. JCM 14467 TaxID=1295370 RepID=UPI0006CFBA8C|nr:N-(5'-phosphoribosyl)anthranilate isomerase [Vulcanisaeta sp. JCM 14467]
MTLLKVCGVTNNRDAVMISKYADYIGVIIHSSIPTPRLVSKDVARDIIRSVKGIKTVGVVEGLGITEAIKLASDLGFDVLQYHGDPELNGEAIDLLNRLGIRLAPVLTYVGDESIIEKAAKLASSDYVEYVLIDAPKVGFNRYEYGLKLPLNVIRRASSLPKVGIAGGINPSNVVVVMSYRPYLIDVSSGVERGPGVKDEELVRRVAEVVRHGS